jgi:hypothetical protein
MELIAMMQQLLSHYKNWPDTVQSAVINSVDMVI